MIIDKLKRAITDQDFSLVADVIRDLTGEEVDVEEDPIQAKIREIEDQLKSLKSKGRKSEVKVEGKANEFDKIVDELDILPEPGEDLINDKIKRQRQPRASNTVKVTCSCGKTEEVSSILARDNYTCQKCLIKKARR